MRELLSKQENALNAQNPLLARDLKRHANDAPDNMKTFGCAASIQPAINTARNVATKFSCRRNMKGNNDSVAYF